MNPSAILRPFVRVFKPATGEALERATRGITEEVGTPKAPDACPVDFLTGLAGLVGFAKEADSVTGCVGIWISSQNLAEVAAAPAGTTFCLRQGTCQISRPVTAESNEIFEGVYKAFLRPTLVTTEAPEVYYASGSYGARLERLRVEGDGRREVMPAVLRTRYLGWYQPRNTKEAYGL